MTILTSTIGQLTLVTSAAAADLIEIEVAASGLSRKITKANLIGATLTGGGSIVTGGFTLTIPKTGTVPVGTGTDGRVAQWSGDANTLAAATLAKTGAGVLTLSAAGAYTLTVPKTGTAVTGTGTTGRIAEWVTDANTVQASTLAKTGAGVLTLAASGAYTLTVSGTSTVNGSLVGSITGGGTLALGAFTLTVPETGTAVLLTATQTLTNKTLTTPTISATGFTNAQHAHTGSTSGGQLTTAALSNLSTLVQTTGAQSIAGDKTFTDDIIANGALRLGTSSETISSGVINYTACMIAVDTEGAAGTDDLTTINGGATGDLLFIRCAANARDVVIKHGTGNIFCGSDRTLTSVTDVICFIYLGSWRCISFADNA